MYLLILLASLNAEQYYYQHHAKIYVQASHLKASPSLHVKHTLYTIKDANITLQSTDSIIIRLKEAHDIDAIVKEYTIKRVANLGSGFFLLKEINSSRLFTLANTLYEDNRTSLSHPNFKQRRFKR